MKIPIQEKIAELERRIEALEKARRPVTTTTTTSTTDPLTPKQEAARDRMWQHFDETFRAMREMFR
jgi:hypothetical protein